MKTESKKSDLIQKAIKRFQISSSAEDNNRENAMHDKRFENGEQWTEDELRERQGRPSVTINKVAGSVKGILGDARQNRPRITVKPVDSNSDPIVAQLMQGIIRNIENASDAEEAYDNGHDNAVRGAYGYWKVVRDYECGDSFDQVLKIERIVNPQSVYFDQEAVKSDYSDAMYCFLCKTLSQDKFKEQYPNKDVADWDRGAGEGSTEWFTTEGVRIAEYYYKEKYVKHIFQLYDGSVIEVRKPKVGTIEGEGSQPVQVVTGESTKKDPETGKPYLIEEPIPFLKTRKADDYKVFQCIISGNEILEGPIEWPGKYIPVVPCLGEEVWIDGERILRSAIRQSIDAQKLYNWARSNQQETLALSPKQPWLLSDKQIGSYKNLWDKAYARPLPYLLYKHVEGEPSPQRLTGSTPDMGANQEAMLASEDIKATMGRFDASLGARSNETSGIAIHQRKMEGDSNTYVFTDNQVRAIKYTGRILVDLIPKIYDTERVVRLVGENLKKKFADNPDVQVDEEDDTSAWARINIVDEQGNIVANDLSLGRYDIVIDAGPGFSTKREEAAAGMIELSKAAPMAMPVLVPKIAKNMDWPEADDLGDELKQLFQPPPPEQPQPDPMMQAQMEMQMQKGQIDLQKSQADLQKKQADIELAKTKGELDIQEKGLEIVKDAQQIATSGEDDSKKMYMIAQKAVVDVLKQLGIGNGN